MIALITGASSGIGRAMAVDFARRGFNLIIVARRRQRLLELKEEVQEKYGVKVRCFCHDLSKTEECLKLYEEVSRVNVDVLVNSAGFGVFGKFHETSLEDELKMIDVNIKALHTLTKLFLQKFRERDKGFILNVASIAGFMPGPEFSSYYASKSYVVSLTKAIHEELRFEKSNVYIGALCPGPVRTEFNEIAGAQFAVTGASDVEVAEYAIEKMFDGQMIIVPGTGTKFLRAAAKYAPENILLSAVGAVQRSRKKIEKDIDIISE